MAHSSSKSQSKTEKSTSQKPPQPNNSNIEEKLDKQKTFNINLKYLFIAVVYLKLRSDLFTNIGERVLEIGINDLIEVYGKGEICQGKLGRYIDCVKAIARDNKLSLKLEISYEQRKELNFLYYKHFLAQTKSTILKNPNAPNFSEKKLEKVYSKVFYFFDGKENCLKNRKIRHFSCAIFYMSLRLIGITITLQQLVTLLKDDPMFSKMLYYSVSRINRDICEEFINKFLFLVEYYRRNKRQVVKHLKGYSSFLSASVREIESLLNQRRTNIKSPLVVKTVTFMLKSKVAKFMKKISRYRAEYYSNNFENEQFQMHMDELTRAETTSNPQIHWRDSQYYSNGGSLSVHSPFQSKIYNNN